MGKLDKMKSKPVAASKGSPLLLIAGLVLAVGMIAAVTMYFSQLPSTPAIGQPGSTHIHSDWAVFVNGQKTNFALPKYMLRARHVHLESMSENAPLDGETIHVHATNMNVGFFLKTLNFDLTSECLTLDTGKYCNTGTSTVKLYVNGQLKDQWGNYIFKDLDKVLISYGPETDAQMQEQISKVTGNSRQASATS